MLKVSAIFQKNGKNQTNLAAQNRKQKNSPNKKIPKQQKPNPPCRRRPTKIQINILKNKETTTIKPTLLPRSQQDLVHSQSLCRTRRSRCLSARKLIEIFISFTSISSGYLSARKLIEISSFFFLQETHLSFCDTGAFIEYFVSSIMTFYEQNRQI